MPIFSVDEFNIGQAAKALRKHTKTLRRWDAKGVLKAQRKENGYRFYTRDQLERFVADHPELFRARLHNVREAAKDMAALRSQGKEGSNDG